MDFKSRYIFEKKREDLLALMIGKRCIY